MVGIAAERFINKVITSKETVQFSHLDPYNHLATYRYTELFVDHRVLAPEECMGLSAMELAQKESLGIVFAKTAVSYLRPVTIGEKIGLASWATSTHKTGFTSHGMLYNLQKMSLKATFYAEHRTINLKTGRVVDMPETFPCTSEELFESCPSKDEFLSQFHKRVADIFQKTIPS